MYPCLCIYRNKIAENVKILIKLCNQYHIEITGITKVFAGAPEIASVFVNNGIKKLGDSRIDNLKKIKNLPAEKWLIRMPTIGEVEEIIKFADVSLNSEVEILFYLNEAAVEFKKKHKVILMYDMGDLREGYIKECEIKMAAELVKKLSHLELYGIGTNMTCLSFVHPDKKKLLKLVELKKKIGTSLLISGGNSATINLMLEGGIPSGVNNIRLGESLLFGRERAYYHYLEGTYKDAFILKAEIIELKEKPSMPWGKIGRDSYNQKPQFEDIGPRLRAICALGKQDIDIETMWPVDEKIKIIGASSDHLILDITNSEYKYVYGDILSFRLGYFATMRAYTSQYVHKVYK